MTVYSIFNSQPDFLSRKQGSEWCTSGQDWCHQTLLSWNWWITDPKPEPSGRCWCWESRSPAQHKLQHLGNPSPTTHNSSRAHSPLPILISLPLAKESPQFPLPPRAAAFFFQVVNYNSRAKSTVNFYSLPKQFNILQAFVSVVQLPMKQSLHLPSLSLHSAFQFFSKHIPFTHHVRRLPNHAFFRKKKFKMFLFF